MSYSAAEDLMISLRNYLDDTPECDTSCGRCAHCIATSLVHALITPGKPTPIQDFVIEPTPEDLWPRDAGDG